MKMTGGRPEQRPALWTRDFWLISLATFFIFTSFQMLMPTLPKYLQFLGAREGIVGLVAGLFSVSALLIRPFIGHELDRRGRRGIYLYGLGFFVLAVLAYRWAPGVWTVFAIRLFHGVAWGMVTTAAGTIVSDIVPPSRRGEGMGYYGMFANLAMAVAPASGLYVLYHYNYPPVFYGSAVLAAVALLLATRLRHNEPRQDPPSPAAPLYEPRALYPALIALLVTFNYGSVVTFLQLYAEQRGITNIGPFFTVYAVTLMSTRPFAGRLYDRLGPHSVIVPGLALIAVALLFLSQAQSLPVFLVAGILYGLGFGAAHPALQALTVTGVPPSRRGAANATFFSAFDLGIAAGALLLGLVAQVSGYPTMYLTAAGVVLLALATYWLLPRAFPQAAAPHREQA